MNEREALKLALEALEKVTKEMLALKDELAERGARPTTNVFHQRLWDSSFKAYTDHALPASIAIREALAQPEQEPVARSKAYDMIDRFLRNNLDDSDYAEYSAALDSIYTTPPHRKPLTDEELRAVIQAKNITPTFTYRYIARAIEAAHGIKE